MNRKSISSAAAALLLATTVSSAQSLFDFQGFGQQLQSRHETEKPVEFDYDFDFQYYLDHRDFDSSQDLFMTSEPCHLARLTPSFGIKVNTDRRFTHRVLAGVDLVKNLGEYPIDEEIFSKDETDPTLVNAKLFKSLILYYNLSSNTGNGRFDLYAGVYPRTVMEGEYSRAIFSEEYKMTDPDLEGVTLKYRGRKFFAEAGCDWLGNMGLDRRERYMVYTAGSFKPFGWLSAGWDVAYTHVGNSFIFKTCVDDVMANPYVKLDFGHMLGIQELSVKAGALASMQLDSHLETEPHFPFGAEAVVTLRNWGLGLENTVYYGDNMMPYRSSAYSEDTSVYTSLLYLGESFYFTRRGYASGYDRLELFYEPLVTDGLTMRLSAIGHYIFPASEVVGTFLGWQAKASLFFNLDSIRNPHRQPARQSSRKAENRRAGTHGNGPEFRL